MNRWIAVKITIDGVVRLVKVCMFSADEEQGSIPTWDIIFSDLKNQKEETDK